MAADALFLCTGVRTPLNKFSDIKYKFLYVERCTYTPVPEVPSQYCGLGHAMTWWINRYAAKATISEYFWVFFLYILFYIVRANFLIFYKARTIKKNKERRKGQKRDRAHTQTLLTLSIHHNTRNIKELIDAQRQMFVKWARTGERNKGDSRLLLFLLFSGWALIS